MPNVNSIRKHFLKSLLFVVFLFTGCTDPEVARQEQIDSAENFAANQDYANALEVLQPLLKEYPNDSKLIEEIAELYLANNDPVMASIYLEQIALNRPNDVDLLFKIYQAKKSIGDDTLPTLQKIASLKPDALNAQSWLEMATALTKANKTQAALNAYLRAIPNDPQKNNPETASTVGSLLLELNNKKSAEPWLEQAIKGTGPDALTSLFGLLEIKLSTADWVGTERVIEMLEKRFPGAIDASDWADARGELETWRKTQADIQTALEANPITTNPAGETPNSQTAMGDAPSGKSIPPEEFDAMEALANTPAVESTAPPTTPDLQDQPVAYNPDIAIQPADPDSAPSFDNLDPINSEDFAFEANELSAPLTPESQSIEQLLAAAETATFQRDFQGAISLYWQALALNNTNPSTWSSLSQAFILSGQSKNAETSALEAIRLAPRTVNYTIDYLRIAQRSKPPKQFIAELKTAYDRFPRNPDIILSLARAYDRLNKDSASAKSLYERFLELAPNHRLRGEAEAALLN